MVIEVLLMIIYAPLMIGRQKLLTRDETAFLCVEQQTPRITFPDTLLELPGFLLELQIRLKNGFIELLVADDAWHGHKVIFVMDLITIHFICFNHARISSCSYHSQIQNCKYTVTFTCAYIPSLKNLQRMVKHLCSY